MTRVALTVEKILAAVRATGASASICADIMNLYKVAYKEGYLDGQLDAEEAHEDVWVEKDEP